MAYKLIVENYGKIEKAELEISPLTLFVGDNNSGKSYLLSLIWTLFSGQGESSICKGMKGLLEQKFSKLYSDLKNLLINQNLENEEFVVVNEEIIISIINELLLMNKDELVKSIFNYEGMSIGRIEVKNKSNRHYVIKKEKEDEEALWIGRYNWSGQYLLANGANTLNGVNSYPNFQWLNIVDPDKIYNDVYNRYAHIGIILAEKTEFRLLTTDSYEVDLTYQNLKDLGIKYYLTDVEYSESEKNQFHLTVKYENTEKGQYIYQVN